MRERRGCIKIRIFFIGKGGRLVDLLRGEDLLQTVGDGVVFELVFVVFAVVVGLFIVVVVVVVDVSVADADDGADADADADADDVDGDDADTGASSPAFFMIGSPNKPSISAL